MEKKDYRPMWKDLGLNLLEEAIGKKVMVPQDPQMVGAYGAAMIAKDQNHGGKWRSSKIWTYRKGGKPDGREREGKKDRGRERRSEQA